MKALQPFVVYSPAAKSIAAHVLLLASRAADLTAPYRPTGRLRAPEVFGVSAGDPVQAWAGAAMLVVLLSPVFREQVWGSHAPLSKTRGLRRRMFPMKPAHLASMLTDHSGLPSPGFFPSL